AFGRGSDDRGGTALRRRERRHGARRVERSATTLRASLRLGRPGWVYDARRTVSDGNALCGKDCSRYGAVTTKAVITWSFSEENYEPHGSANSAEESQPVRPRTVARRLVGARHPLRLRR